jgi:exodeoxyribonuclease VII small subunit
VSDTRQRGAATGGGGDASGAPQPSFEQAHAELERIVERLERGDVPLEEAIALWQRGEELYRLCLAKLEGAQGRIDELSREGAAPE